MDGDCVVREYRDSTGCKVLFDSTGQGDRPAGYSGFLRGVLSRWEPSSLPLPLVISGMASSTIGWKELPYARVPLRLDGSTLRWEALSWDRPGWIGMTYLISGSSTENDIMRGEETEAIGLLQGIRLPGDLTLILPGTHSKHLRISNGEIVDFTTFMTGELFEILTRHSILKATTTVGGEIELDAFDSGVRQARDAGLGASLFKTRTRAILKGCPARENAAFLSGLLIAAELCEIASGGSVFLGGAPELRRLYARALNGIDEQSFQWQEFTDAQVLNAVPKAHAAFLKCLNSH